MMLDCAIIGGGPGGLNAALVLGRARRKVIVFDNNKPRNAVTRVSHGFITRDGVSLNEFREMAHNEIEQYPSVKIENKNITGIQKEAHSFYITTEDDQVFQAKKIILATGLKEEFPPVNGIEKFYGKSLFSCPYCDGWELRDTPLIFISETPNTQFMSKIYFNWSKDLIVCTNGKEVMNSEQIKELQNYGIKVYTQKIQSLLGDNGNLRGLILEDGTELERQAGFIMPKLSQASLFHKSLGCNTNDMGAIITDDFGRTNISGVYAGGDSAVIAPTQLVIAAGEGSRAAIGVNQDLTKDEFETN
ncbi:NAD(P)/FAD-dependent oxidoreductase [Sporosarcina soli]|uniref:NAD(P)/FAD-dependent oxidoreductase n=1 Tax=Sporosarcina soli TaxID=334736 RepID=A0ABW0TRW8_9BACL